MRALHAMMMLLGALAVLMAGGVPAGASAEAPPAPPCHEAPAHHAGGQSPSPAPGTAVKAMDCCVACVATPPLQPPERARLSAPAPAIVAPPVAVPVGERPAPEPHPPRPLLD